jgi:hypothetical protein
VQRRYFWPKRIKKKKRKKKRKKARLGTDAGMEAQPLKKALPEGGIQSLFVMLSAPSKLIGWPEGTSAAACVAMVERTAQP